MKNRLVSGQAGGKKDDGLIRPPKQNKNNEENQLSDVQDEDFVVVGK